MHRLTKSSAALLVTFITVLGLAIGVRQTAAATGQLYLSPSSNTVQNGNTFDVAVRINPGTNVDGVTAQLSYDQTKLQYVSNSAAGSAFEVALGSQSGGSGTVTLNRGTFSGGVSSDALVATVTFKALVGSGSSPIGLSGNATASGNYTGPSVVGATAYFSTPPVVTPPVTTPPVTTGSGSSSGSTSSNSSTTHSSGSNSSHSSAGGSTTTPATTTTTPTAATTVTVANKMVGYTEATLNITTSVPTQAYIVYGIDGQFNLQTPETDLSVDHTLTIQNAALQAGTTYNYQIVTVDANGTQTKSDPATFTTTGYSVRLKLVDSKGKPLANKVIALGDKSFSKRTDSQGRVTYTGLKAGQYKVSYTQGKKTYSKTIVVENNAQQGADGSQTAAMQNVSVVFDSLQVQSGSILKFLPILLLILVLAVGVYFLYRKRNGGGPSAMDYAPPAPTVVTMSEPSSPQSVSSTDIGPSADVQPAIFDKAFPTVPTPGVTLQPEKKDEL